MSLVAAARTSGYGVIYWITLLQDAVLDSSGRTALLSGEQIHSLLLVPRNAPVRRRDGF